ncbi:uncharacterized protein I303_103972 [Kwoniella dejecticola CBS 10117]|uniref:Uncharacterized protein n=1 Tax=Kwoniella dejecticola CBS 10117 TaxID=1296121 RepID=A0A1A6A884_9TREE|nr:uncharacterized protein I303_03989 [Kwoniella dejecticola CBS 10117]OBR86267.1 hypothetical protein I303_03989 [Kwoniella dejecticola CBS 10117]
MSEQQDKITTNAGSQQKSTGGDSTYAASSTATTGTSGSTGPENLVITDFGRGFFQHLGISEEDLKRAIMESHSSTTNRSEARGTQNGQ